MLIVFSVLSQPVYYESVILCVMDGGELTVWQGISRWHFLDNLIHSLYFRVDVAQFAWMCQTDVLQQDSTLWRLHQLKPYVKLLQNIYVDGQ